MTKSKPKKMNTGGLAKSQKSLKSWTKQDWRTKSGKPSTQGANATGERYLPAKAIKSLSSSEYAATTRAKRKGTKAGKQHVPQPKKVAEKTRQFRANKGGATVKSPRQQAAIAVSMKKRGVKPKGK